MKINWKIRVKNRLFWVSIIPAALVLAQLILRLFGVSFDPEGLAGQLVEIVNAVFVVLSILGIVADPTTQGLGDSRRALGYELPYEDVGEVTEDV